MSEEKKSHYFNADNLREILEKRGIELPWLWQYDEIMEELEYLVYQDDEANGDLIDDIKEKAYDEGFKDGEKEQQKEAHEEGYIKGYKRGYQLGYEDKRDDATKALEDALEILKINKVSKPYDFDARQAMYDEQEEEELQEALKEKAKRDAEQAKDDVEFKSEMPTHLHHSHLTLESVSKVSDLVAAATPKKRGRPKGSKNKPKTA